MNYESLETQANGGGDISARQDVRSFIAAGTIAAQDWVSFDISQTDVGDKFSRIVQASTGANKKCCFGVALNGGSAGDRIEVVVAGPALAKVKSTVAAENDLKITGVVGEADIATSSDLVPKIGRALEGYDASGTLCWVHRTY